jgi:DNA-binding beta-propeller fold protein YncE
MKSAVFYRESSMTKSVLAGAITIILAGLSLAMAAQPTTGASGLKVVARIPGPDGGWDYASFDPVRRRVYVAHGLQVMMIDADTNKVTPAFAAGDRLHAVVPVPGTSLVVTTNSGDSSAKIISATDGKLIASVPTSKDPDGAVFDPSTGLVMVIGGDSGVVTMVDPKAGKATGSINVGGSLEFPAVDGKGRLYINVEDKNEIAVVDIATRGVVAHYPLAGCQRPTGLMLVAGNRLVSACGNGAAKILDAASGHEIASFKIGGFPDAVLCDAGRGLAYIPSALSGNLAVIALGGPANNTIIDTVPTQLGARTGAVDPKTGRIYLPTAQYVLPAPAGQRPSTKPGAFEVLVLDR